MSDWVLDTFVLYEAGNLRDDAIYILSAIREKGVYVVVDFEGHIESEYRRSISRLRQDGAQGYDYVSRWIQYVIATRVYRFSGKLSRRHRNHLLDKLEFDINDIPFVAVCSNSLSKRLVAHDSDYDEEVRAYINDKLGVHVLSMTQAKKLV